MSTELVWIGLGISGLALLYGVLCIADADRRVDLMIDAALAEPRDACDGATFPAISGGETNAD